MSTADTWILIAAFVQSALIAILIVMIRQENKKPSRHSR